MSVRDWINLFFAGVLAVCACLTLVLIFVQVIIYGCQLWQMKKSTDAATKAAKAAENSVTLARENAHLDQRAWVTTKRATLEKPPAIGEPLSVIVEIINSGRTPALGLQFASKVFSSDHLTDSDLGGPRRGTGSRGVLGPQNDAIIVCLSEQPLNNQLQVDNIQNGITCIYVSGVIDYIDIFKQPHQTKFCFKLCGKVEVERKKMSSCEIGDTAD